MFRSSIFLILFTLACGSTDDSAAGITPDLSVETREFLEGNGSAQNISIEIILSGASDQIVSLSYTTQEKSAVEGIDFEASSGNLSFAVGEVEKSIQVTIIPDEHLEFDEKFILNLTNIVNTTSSSMEVPITLLDDDDYTPEEIADGFITPVAYPSMDLVWSDEFDGLELNGDDWNFELGDGCPNLCGWGNGELQHYTEENTRLQDGNLTITAENPMGNLYSSSRITTKGKQEFKWGRIDIRARLPYGQGIWPALWMLGGNIDDVGWPVCGEIDVMEMVGHQAGTVHGTAHFDRDGHHFTGTGWSLNSPEQYSDKFHVFTILWQEGLIEWFVDYHKYFTIKAKDVGFNYPFDDPFFFIANIAVGGQWPGDPDETTSFPQTMEIDYIRVFQTPNLE